MFVIDRYTDSDAPGLAELWQASQDVWLGGFHGGVPMTPERVRQAESGSDRLLTLVARAGKRVIGYCRLGLRFADPSAAYVAELGVHPAFHGQGVGRDLLRRAIDFAITAGYLRVDLHTWPGNERALPLYKRAGFLWVPGTRVLMENYLPTLLKQPLVEKFLDQQDWYASLRQPVSMAPDDDFEQGRPVFRYHFRRDGQSLSIILDRASRAVMALSSDDWQVGLIAPVATTPGRASSAHLQIRRPNGESTTPALATIRLTGGSASERSMVLTDTTTDLALPMEAPRHNLASMATVTGTLSIEGKITSLSAAIVLAPLVSVELLQSEAAMAGVIQQVTVRLRNNHVQTAQFQISLTPTDMLTVNPRRQDVTLTPGTSRDLPLQILASRAGVYELGIGLISDRHNGTILQPIMTFPVPVVDEFASIAYQTKEALILENVHFRAQLILNGGALELRERSTGVQHSQLPTLGPPTWNPLVSHVGFSGRIARTTTGWRAVLTGELSRWPGISFERAVEISASPVLRIQHRVHNRGPTDHLFTLSLSHGQPGPASPGVTNVLPLEAGLLTAEQPQFPDWRDGSPPFAENWLAREKDGGVLGVIWPTGSDVRWESWRGAILTLPPVLAPSQHERKFVDVSLYLGPGDWHAVRATWQRHQSTGSAFDVSAPLLGALATLPPALTVVCQNGESQAETTVWSIAARPQSVEIAAEPPDGWVLQVAPRDLGLLDQSVSRDVRIMARHEAGRFADVGTLLLHGERDTSGSPVYLLDPGRSDAPVVIRETFQEGHRVYSVDNRRFQVVVVPGFAGSAISLRDGDHDILWSAFPNPGRLPYCNPWFGGISPQIGPIGETEPGQGGFLDSEKLTATTVDAEVFRGQRWRGVRLSGVSSTVGHLQIAVEYLTLGESPILLLALDLINQARIAVTLAVGWTVNLSDLAPDQPKWLRWREAWTGYRRCSPHKVEVIPAERWVIAGQGNTPTGTALAVAPPLHALAIDLGPDRAHLGAYGTIPLLPGSRVRTVAALANVERTIEARVLAEALSRAMTV